MNEMNFDFPDLSRFEDAKHQLYRELSYGDYNYGINCYEPYRRITIYSNCSEIEKVAQICRIHGGVYQHN